MKKIVLALALICVSLTIKGQNWDTTGDNQTTGKVSAKEFSFPLVNYDFSKQPRLQSEPMTIKLFDDYVTDRPGGSAPQSNNYGTLLSIYGRSNHWESNIYFGANTKKMYFRTSVHTTWTSDNGVAGGFNNWRTLLDSKSDIQSTGLLKISGDGDHYFLNGKVGIGTGNPEGKLHILNASTIASSNLGNSSILIGSIASGIGIDPNEIKASTDLHIGTISNNSIHFQTYGNDKRMTILANGNIGIGTDLSLNPNNYRLAVNGTIGAKEVKVENTSSTWPDFVFEEQYNLPTLAEVEEHIKEKGHLPSIPSAKEVEKNGIFLGEMNAKLLQKIEELTLYTIQQQKELNAEKEKNTSLEKRLLKLEKIITTIIE